ncbi:DNA repair protein RadC [Pseudomonas sp. 25 R 14]|uniref:RadC family protein n=1 Tax=Pseudomonas sp. 25 R 14 TaxID=1844109 RepID=UPI0008121639|nr:DNA repair protein RadC [Pseudomonas sp. 25 R 14]CRM57196.1 DNA repair protein RadC [Pseudomonas sp. 25 R 14]
MNIPLMQVDTSTLETDRRTEENQVIDHALHILDRRLFTRGPSLTSPNTVAAYLKLQLVQHEHEVFGVVFLDAKHRVLAFEVLFYGSIEGASVYPRQVVKRSLAHNAAATIFVHNHPSGCTAPSQADRVLTARLKAALALIDIHVLDHFIVGEGPPLSFAEYGWL